MSAQSDRTRFAAGMRRHLRAARLRVLAAGVPACLGGIAVAAVAAAAIAGTGLGEWRIVKLLLWAGLPAAVVLLVRRTVAAPLAEVRSPAALCRLLETRGSFRNLLIAAEEAIRRPDRWPSGTPRRDETLELLFGAAAAASARIERRRLLPLRDPAGNLLALACGAALAVWAFWSVPLARTGAERLAHPLRAEGRPPAAGIYLESGDLVVAAGDDVELLALDFGSPSGPAVCEVRRGSGLWRPVDAPAVGAQPAFLRYSVSLGSVGESFLYRFRRDGTATPPARVEVMHPPLVSGLAGAYAPPSYTGLPERRLDLLPVRLEVPAGSRLSWRGRADHRLAAAWAVTTDGDSLALDVRADSLRGAMTVDGAAEFRIGVRDTAGLTGSGLAYRVEPIPDRVPEASLVHDGDPGLLPADSRLTLLAGAEDDYGLSRLDLRIRREHAFAPGPAGPGDWIELPLWRRDGSSSGTAVGGGMRELATRLGPVRIAVDHEPEIGARASVAVLLDAGDLDLVPGDVLVLQLAAADNREPPPAGVGLSRKLRLTLPSAAEMIAERARDDAEHMTDMQDLLSRSSRIGEDLERVARELKKDPLPDFDRRRELETTLDSQRRLQQELQDLAGELQAEMDELAATNQTSVPLLEKMAQVTELIENLGDERLDRMRERLGGEIEKMSPAEIAEAVAEAARNQQELLEKLDRAIALLEEMNRERDMESMTGVVERMIREQQELLEPKAVPDPAAGDSRRQEALADEASRLEERLREALDDLDRRAGEGRSSPTDESLREAVEEALRRMEQQGIEQTMREAAREMSAGDSSGADRAGREAMRALAGLYSVMLRGQQAMQQAMERHVAAALRRIAFDVLSLSRRQEEVAGSIPANLRNVRAPRLARSEARLLRAISGLESRLKDLMADSPMVAGSLLTRLRTVAEHLEKARVDLSAGWGAEARASARRGLGGMNNLVINLLTNAESAASGQGSGGMSLFSEQLRSMAREQAGLNGLAEMLRRGEADGGRLSQRQRAAMERLRAEQRDLAGQARELAERERSDPEAARRLLGDLGDIADQMEQVVRDLGSGALDEQTLRRQERILGRLLDAHNSVRRRDFTTRRESLAAGGGASRQRGEIPESALAPSARRARQMRIEKVPLEYRDLVRRYFRALDRIDAAAPPEVSE